MKRLTNFMLDKIGDIDNIVNGVETDRNEALF